MTLGLVIGKFYPPHRGHKHLIETARRQCDRLVVVLPHHPSQTIPGEVRKGWLEEIHPDCEIHLVPDELENDSKQWAEWTVRYLGRAPDVVFSSEDYGPEYAGLMGARHVMVDRERAIVPVSGTKVRGEPGRWLEYLEPCVRAWFVPRVVIVGAESTGKTTLARYLAERFGTVWVPEYGREHWEKKYRDWNEKPPGWTEEEFIHISREQKRREDLAARSANRVLVCDTNAFATATWYERYFGRRHSQLDQWGAEDRVSLYLIPNVDVPFVQDGWRDGETIRGWMHERFVELVAKTGAPYRILKGSWEDRNAQAVGAVEEATGTSAGE